MLLIRYIAFLSGFDLGSRSDCLLSLQEMIFALTGKTGTPEVQEKMSRISRLIIAGYSYFITTLKD